MSTGKGMKKIGAIVIRRSLGIGLLRISYTAFYTVDVLGE
jgi:hypothetical protein